jgi:alpha-mannosidase
MLREVRAHDGGLLQTELAILARDVPAMGYSIFRLLPRRVPAASKALPPDEPVLENAFYRLEFDPGTGAIVRLSAKSPSWDVLDAPGNVVAREEDRGDLWELYQNLNAGLFVTSKTPHPAPQSGQAVFSSEQSAERGTVCRGPVFSEFQVAHPFGGENHFATTVRLYHELRRIDIRTRILNHEKSVRYRVLFPTSIRDGQSVHEIPFGATERPVGIELPAQNWVDYGDGERGLALLNRGLPGNNVHDGTMMLSLARSARIQAYGYGGGYEPGMSSDSGFELGTAFTFDYALVPHAGDWREAGVYRDALEFNQPLLARTVAPHPGVLPNRWGLLQISPSNVVMTALKPGSDGTAVLRIYEATGTPTSAALRFSAPITAAEEVNLLEDAGSALAVGDGPLQVDLRAFEIKTIRVWLAPPTAATR